MKQITALAIAAALTMSLAAGLSSPAGASGSKGVRVTLVAVKVVSDGDNVFAGCGEFSSGPFAVGDPAGGPSLGGRWKPAAPAADWTTWSLCEGQTYTLPPNEFYADNVIARTVAGNAVNVSIGATEYDVASIKCVASTLEQIALPAVGASKSTTMTVADDCDAQKAIDLRFTVKVTRTS